MRAAPIFDSKERSFVGMLTITDFIQILNKLVLFFKHTQSNLYITCLDITQKARSVKAFKSWKSTRFVLGVKSLKMMGI